MRKFNANKTLANAILTESPDPLQLRYSRGSCNIEHDKLLIAGYELCPNNEDDTEVLAIIAADPKFGNVKNIIESARHDYDRINSCARRFLVDVQAGSCPVVAHDPYTGWELFMDDHSYSIYGAVRVLNACLKALADECRLAKVAPPEPMTDQRALAEIEEAQEVLQKHYDNGFLLGFWHEQYDDFQYRYVEGEYARRAEVEAEDAAKAA